MVGVAGLPARQVRVVSTRGLMIRTPEVEHRGRGVRRWSVAWGLYFPNTMRSETRRRMFFTQRGAEGWIERKRIKPEDRWRAVTPPAKAVCGATEWAHCDDGRPHVYRVCNRAPHDDRWHREEREGRLWAESSGDSGPIPPGPLCEHAAPSYPPGNTRGGSDG